MDDPVQGFQSPNYTQTPNDLFELMKKMGLSELKCLLAIIRATFGWHRSKAMLSLSVLEKMTGLSHQGVVDGLGELNKKKLVWKQYDPDTKTAIYGVNVIDYPPQVEDKVVNVLDYPSPPEVNDIDSPRVNDLDSNKERINKENEMKEMLSLPFSKNPYKCWYAIKQQLLMDGGKRSAYSAAIEESTGIKFDEETRKLVITVPTIARAYFNTILSSYINRMLPGLTDGQYTGFRIE